MTLKQVIEALIFASPKPLTVPEMVSALRAAGEKATEGPERELAGAGEETIAAALAETAEEIRQAGRGFLLLEQVNGWALVTHPDAAPWVRRLYPEAKPTRLSGPALETLAIIAYRQPVTRADVEAVRGVAVDGVMQVLLDRGLVRIAGRADVPGRPLLYSTTEFFLQHFGLKSTDELPNASELKRLVLPTAPPPPAAGETAPAAATAVATVSSPEAPAASPDAPAAFPETPAATETAAAAEAPAQDEIAASSPTEPAADDMPPEESGASGASTDSASEN